VTGAKTDNTPEMSGVVHYRTCHPNPNPNSYPNITLTLNLTIT